MLQESAMTSSYEPEDDDLGVWLEEMVSGERACLPAHFLELLTQQEGTPLPSLPSGQSQSTWTPPTLAELSSTGTFR